MKFDKSGQTDYIYSNSNPCIMKTGYFLPFVLLCVVSFLPACEYDKINTTVQYYTPEEFHVLSEKLNLPSKPFNYENFNFETNYIDGSGTLGRVLFYDTNLSSDHSVSCGSCHQQHLGFADNVAFSKGIMNRSTARNSIALGSFRSFGSYSGDPRTTLFWDGRVDNLHDQMIQTIANPNEMGMEMDQVVERVKGLDYYNILIEKAFGHTQINSHLILSALQNFMNSISSSTTRFDDIATQNGFFLTSSPWQGFTQAENMGKSLFVQNCVSCHNQGLGNISNNINIDDNLRSANNGLDLVYDDKGEGEINPSPDALAIFKIPGMRNIELTGPYMHDGRFGTLEEVIDFYSDGIQNHQNLHSFLKENGQPKKFNFTATEKDALVQFLKTFTDHPMTQEEKWSDPFL